MAWVPHRQQEQGERPWGPAGPAVTGLAGWAGTDWDPEEHVSPPPPPPTPSSAGEKSGHTRGDGHLQYSHHFSHTRGIEINTT